MSEEIQRKSGALWQSLGPSARRMRKAPTRAEAAMWKLLRDRRLSGLKFRRQHAFGRFIVDFYCPSANLVVEIDGAIHDAQPGHDYERQTVLESLGLTVIRFTNDEVLSSPGTTLDAIIKATQV